MVWWKGGDKIEEDGLGYLGTEALSGILDRTAVCERAHCY